MDVTPYQQDVLDQLTILGACVQLVCVFVVFALSALVVKALW